MEINPKAVAIPNTRKLIITVTNDIFFWPKPLLKKEKEMAARRRDLLKQYYQQDEEPLISPIQQKRIDPLDIDSEDYHAQVAFNLSAKELGFVELLTNHNNLTTDIKELDGNVKSLIYQNYAKFLTAQSVIVKVLGMACAYSIRLTLTLRTLANT
jgi:Vps51/Vps67